MNEDFLEITESWRVVDRWWTDNPEERFFIALRAPNGDTIAVSWDKENQWTFHGDPRPKIDIELTSDA
jgi:hypothetical protein